MFKVIKNLLFPMSILTCVSSIAAQTYIRSCYSQISAIIVIAVVVLSARSAESATYKLPDCSQTTVQSYITNKASDRDVLVCPAGSWTWTTTTSNTPSVLINKAITLVGAGFDIVNNVPTPNTTTIVDGTTNKWIANEAAIKVIGVAGKMTRITGFSFSGSEDSGVIVVGGPTFWKLFRLDHCLFTNGGTSIAFHSVYGVVDHCTFTQNDIPLSIRAIGNGTYAADNSSSSFVQPNPAGTDNAVYVEDCTFNGNGYPAAADGEAGGHLTFRHNIFNNSGIQIHDTAYTGNRGSRHLEVYSNAFNATKYMSWAINVRSGTGVFHDNVFSGNYDRAISLTNYRSWDTSNGESIAKWGWCDGTVSCDGNDLSNPPANKGSVPSGYPCMDQIGRITDTNWSGPTCYANSGKAGPAQPLDPVYAWNNKFNSNTYSNVIYVHGGCKTNANGVSICVTDHIKSGRDYYDNVQDSNGNAISKPSYKPFRYPHPLADPSVPKLGSN
jgi:hypothetical protein